MSLKILGQAAGALVLTVGLAGCMDITMDVEVLSEAGGRLTTTSVMGADFYAMAKSGMGAAAAEGGDASADTDFCKEAGATLTENPDGSATCVVVVEGTFEELKAGDSEDDGARYEVVSPGVVKVSFSTEDMSGELGAEGQDEQTKAMMAALFEGRSVTIRITGREIIDTNLTRSADGRSAEIVIPFLDLLNGTTQLPPELFATVRAN